MKNLKDHIKGTVKFQFYRAGNLYYKTSTGLEFPVPIEDVGNATILNEDKGMLFMRYIRKHLKALEQANCKPDWKEHLDIEIGNNIWWRECSKCGLNEDL